ncbi:egg cell-secreted protein 1.4-like protein [Carex littledalei]|uniref:Egg cell-secreted protein 1.4-like protein n=1 Tax=Carex littledalei TaxID=544730 RepID=A0A833R4K0_9POAL|nr:egg cell-secreted protein 1.4-like protein [Carex littledalei]
MAPLKISFLTILLLTITLSTITNPTEARSFPPNLKARLQSNGLIQCWDSLIELRTCTGEIILFFVNGETYIGPSCCRAIGVIQHQCWAADAMLAALGLTAEEGDVLRGYCDASKEQNYAPVSAPQVAPGPAPVAALA